MLSGKNNNNKDEIKIVQNDAPTWQNKTKQKKTKQKKSRLHAMFLKFLALLESEKRTKYKRCRV